MNPYAKKVSVWTKDRIAQLAAQNRAERLKRYPETAQFDAAHYEPQVSTVVQIRERRK